MHDASPPTAPPAAHGINSRVRAGLRTAPREMPDDERQMSALVSQLYPRLKAWALTLVAADDADDIVQDAFVRFWRREARREDGDANPNPAASLMQYVHDIAREQARQSVRRRNAVLRAGGAVSQFVATHVSSPFISGIRGWMFPGAAMERSQTDPVLLAAIDALAPRQREVFVLVAGHDLSFEKVGALLHIGASSARSNYARANARLRATLAPTRAPHASRAGAIPRQEDA